MTPDLATLSDDDLDALLRQIQAERRRRTLKARKSRPRMVGTDS